MSRKKRRTRKVKRISRKKSRKKQYRNKKGGAFLSSFSLSSRNDPDEITIKDRNIDYLQLLPGETETQKPSPNWVYKVIGSHRKGLNRNKYLKVQKESTDDMPIYEILKSNAIEHKRSHAVAPISWRTGGEIL
jgi:hypothetical protein